MHIKIISPFFMTLLLLLAAGCQNVIYPPKTISRPETIAVVDHGVHSSLVLPRGAEQSVVYVFGDWDWYGKGNKNLYTGIPAILWPTRGGLGRRFIPTVPGSGELPRYLPGEEYLEFQVEQAEVVRFVKAMDKWFEKQNGAMHQNGHNKFHFVPHKKQYYGYYNCNCATISWLEHLGCEVSGSGLFSNFQVTRDSIITPPQEPRKSVTESKTVRGETKEQR